MPLLHASYPCLCLFLFSSLFNFSCVPRWRRARLELFSVSYLFSFNLAED